MKITLKSGGVIIVGIILALLAGGEWTGYTDFCKEEVVIEDKVVEPPPKAEPVDCPIKVIGYVNNCQTGATDKYFCEYIGEGAPCRSTEEILSELG